jgi:HSP20 family molecular chaperone IbpA
MLPPAAGAHPWNEAADLRTEIQWPPAAMFDPMPCILQSDTEFTPPVDLYETETEVVLTIALPGLYPGDLLIEVTRDTVSIDRIWRPAVPEESARMHRRGGHGRYDLRVHLPVRVKVDQARATYRNGVLEVRMPLGAR